MKKLFIFVVFAICVIASIFITKRIIEKPEPTPTNLPTPVSQQDPTPASQPDPTPASQPDPAPASQPDPAPVPHVKITFAEIKKLIKNGTYERDRRISKQYSVEYVEVSEDDAITGLQQNLTYVQERVEYGEDGDGWRDFDVVGVDYDKKSGLVNCIKIKPIY